MADHKTKYIVVANPKNKSGKSRIKAVELGDHIRDVLEGTAEQVMLAELRGIQRCGDEVMQEIKRNAHFAGRGDYIKAMRTKVDRGLYKTKLYWYVEPPYHRLTHLLEHGHMKRSGRGRTRAFRHIEPGERLARNRLEPLVKEELEKILKGEK